MQNLRGCSQPGRRAKKFPLINYVLPNLKAFYPHMALKFSFKCHLIFLQINVLSHHTKSAGKYSNSVNLQRGKASRRVPNVSLKIWIHSKKKVACHFSTTVTVSVGRGDKKNIENRCNLNYNFKNIMQNID